MNKRSKHVRNNKYIKVAITFYFVVKFLFFSLASVWSFWSLLAKYHQPIQHLPWRWRIVFQQSSINNVLTEKMERVKNDERRRGGDEGERWELAKIVYADQQRAVKNVFFPSAVTVISLFTYSAYSYLIDLFFQFFIMICKSYSFRGML